MTFRDYCVINGKKYVIIDSGLNSELLRENDVIATGSYWDCKDKLYQIRWEAKQ